MKQIIKIKKQKGIENRRIVSNQLYIQYLRTYDAYSASYSDNDIAQIIHPHKDNTDASGRNAQSTAKDQYKAAKILVDKNYRFLGLK